MTGYKSKLLLVLTLVLFIPGYALGGSCSTEAGGMCEGYDKAICMYDMPGGTFHPSTNFCMQNVRMYNFKYKGEAESPIECKLRDFACYCFNTDPCPKPFEVKNIQHTVGSTTATISWNTKWAEQTGSIKPGTDWPTNATIYYGTTEEYSHSVTTDETNGTHTATITGLQPGSTYHFKISAEDELENLVNSTDLTFTTEQLPNTPPTVPTPEEPADGAMVETSPTIRWSSSYDNDGDTITYELQVDDKQQFDSPTTRSTQLTYIDDLTLVPGTYYWRVRAYDGKDYSNWSEVWSFTIEEQDTTPPTSNHPTDITVEQDGEATVNWILHDETLPGKYKVTKDGSTYVNWTPWENGTQINVPIDTGEVGTHQYTIYFDDAAGNAGTPDTVVVEIILGQQPPTIPNLISPKNGASMYENPQVSWEESIDPNGDSITYELLVDNAPGFSSPEIHKSGLTTTGYQTEGLSIDTYYWKVRAYDGKDHSNWSEVRQFTITNKPSPQGQLTELPSGNWDETYPAQTIVSCSLTAGDAGTPLELQRDGETVAVGTTPSETTTMAAGSYSYSCHYPETENYSSAVLDTKTLNVEKGSRTVNVTFDKESPVQYGTPLTVNCDVSSTPSDGQIHLYMNGTDISGLAGKEHVYPAGYWIFACNVSEGENYTGAQDTKPFKVKPPNNRPVATITYPKNGVYYPHLDSFNFTAIDDDAFEMICNYTVDGANGQTNAENGTVTIVPVSPMGTGEHTISISCFDGETWSEPSTVDFFIDSAPPDIQITLPENNSYINSSILAYVGYDNVGIDHYEVKEDDGMWINNGLSTSYEFSLTNGAHTLCVKAVDDVGNSNTSCVTVVYDTIPPEITIHSPENQTVFGTNEITITYSSTAADIAYSQYKVDEGEWLTDDNGSPTTVTGLSDGWHYIYVRSVDLTGNIGPAQVVYVRVDTTRPTVIVESPENNSEYNVDWVVAEFNSPDEDVKGFEYSYDNEEWMNMGIEEPQADETYSFNFTNLPEGVDSIYIRAYDSVGLGEPALLLVNISLPHIPPSVTITYPTNDTYYVSMTAFRFIPTDDKEISLVCNYSVDSGAWQTAVAANGSERVVSISIGEGYHEIRVKCFDGGFWSNESMVYFYVDTSGPIVTITSPENYTYQNEAHFEYTATDNGGSGIDYYEVKTGAGAWIQTTEPSHTFSLSDGQHWLYARAVDKLGNVGPIAKVAVNIDTQPPEITMIAPMNNTNTTATDVDIYYTSSSSDLDNYEVKQDNGGWINKGTIDWHMFYSLSDGTHNLYAKAVDVTRNEKVVFLMSTHNPP